MKNKGFTLIELLAVIVILAIIALIAVPIVLNIINNAREQANQRSVELYGKAVEQAIVNYELNHSSDKIDGVYFSGTARGTLSKWIYSIEMDGADPVGYIKTEEVINNLKINYEGTEVSCKLIRIYEDGTLYMNFCSVGDHEVDYTYGKYKQTYKPQSYWFDYNTIDQCDGSIEDNKKKLSEINTHGHQFYIGFGLSPDLNLTDWYSVDAVYVCFQRNKNEYCLKKGVSYYDYETQSEHITSYSQTNIDVIKEAFADVFETSACSSDYGNNYVCNSDGLTVVLTGTEAYVYDSTAQCEVGISDGGYYKCYNR